MRVGRSTHPKWRQSAVTKSWRMPWQFRRRARSDDRPSKYDDDFEPPEWFDRGDFDLPASGRPGGWREIDTWAFGGLGLFERVVDPLPSPSFDFYDQRVGLEFENELYDMTEAAIPLLTAFLGGVTWHTEFPYGWQGGRGVDQGRTDIVVCEFDWEAYWKRRRIVGATSLSDRNWGYFRAYRYLGDRTMTKQEFIKNGPYSDSYNREIWGWLEKRGYLASNGRLGGASHATSMPLPDHVKAAHAVELKQSTWEEALEQAQRANGTEDSSNAGYADYRWVALDAGHLKAAWEHREAFERAGVGLLGVAEGGIVQLVDADRCEHPPESLDRMKLIEDSVAELTPDEAEVAKAQADDEAAKDPPEEAAQMSIDVFNHAE